MQNDPLQIRKQLIEELFNLPERECLWGYWEVTDLEILELGEEYFSEN